VFSLIEVRVRVFVSFSLKSGKTMEDGSSHSKVVVCEGNPAATMRLSV